MIFMLLIRPISLDRKEIGWSLARSSKNYYMTTIAEAYLGPYEEMTNLTMNVSMRITKHNIW